MSAMKVLSIQAVIIKLVGQITFGSSLRNDAPVSCSDKALELPPTVYR